jgi:hypothetical protein
MEAKGQRLSVNKKDQANGPVKVKLISAASYWPIRDQTNICDSETLRPRVMLTMQNKYGALLKSH